MPAGLCRLGVGPVLVGYNETKLKKRGRTKHPPQQANKKMIRSSPGQPRPLRKVLVLILVLIFWGLALVFLYSYIRPFLPGSLTTKEGATTEAPATLARKAGPVFSLAEADQPLDLNYLQQFCPDQSDPAAPGLCHLEESQVESLATVLDPQELACWQQIYDYAFGPLADQPYLGGNPPTAAAAANPEPVTCHQGVITVLVNPDLTSQIEADGNDVARYQDVLFIVSAIIEYEAYRTRPPTNWSQLDSSVNFSYYDPANVNLPGTWDTYPATNGAIPSLVSGEPSGPDQMAVDPDSRQLPLPTSGRWGDADQANDPRLLMLFHQAACTGGGESPVKLAGRQRYAVVYRPATDEGFACHDF